MGIALTRTLCSRLLEEAQSENVHAKREYPALAKQQTSQLGLGRVLEFHIGCCRFLFHCRRDLLCDGEFPETSESGLRGTPHRVMHVRSPGMRIMENPREFSLRIWLVLVTAVATWPWARFSGCLKSTPPLQLSQTPTGRLQRTLDVNIMHAGSQSQPEKFIEMPMCLQSDFAYSPRLEHLRAAL